MSNKKPISIKQLKSLVNEDRMSQVDWELADKALLLKKKEIARRGVQIYDNFLEHFFSVITKEFIDNNIVFHSGTPEDSVEEFLRAIAGRIGIARLVDEMYLNDE